MAGGQKELVIKCFGKLETFMDGVEQNPYMNSLKARELIALLLTYRGEAVNKSVVCESLWEDQPIKHSKDNLYKLLRKIERMPIPFIISNSRGMIQLSMDNIECELITFEKLLQDKGDIEKMEKAVS